MVGMPTKKSGPLDLAAQMLRDGHRGLLNINVREVASIQPGAEPVFGSLSLGLPLTTRQNHSGSRSRRDGAALAFGRFALADRLRLPTSVLASAHWNRSPC